jgi:anti-anti-sigma factor
MPIETFRQGNATIARIEGRLDISNSATFETEAGIVLADGSPVVVFDCAKLTYVSSAGLRAFLVLHKRLHAVGRRLRLCGLQPAVRQVFDMSGFSDIFELHPTLEQAVG